MQYLNYNLKQFDININFKKSKMKETNLKSDNNGLSSISGIVYNHGIILKNYINVNTEYEKGGVKKLAKLLGITRQGVYTLYNQPIIRKKYRKLIIDIFNLRPDFFPPALSYKESYRLLLLEYTKLENKHKKLETN